MDASVIRTAQDAFQAKASAFLSSGYKLASDQEPSSSLSNDQQDLVANYLKLLDSFGSTQPLSDTNRKSRQSPLVNAGYAIRVATLLGQIQRFVRYHEHQTQTDNDSRPATICIVILGAGLDPIGLAALLSCQQHFDVQLIEVDFPTIIQVKHEILTQLCNSSTSTSPLPMQQSAQSTSRSHYSFDCSGRSSSSYHLVTADLRDEKALHEALAPILNVDDVTTPTLILSELVLAYLPPKNCNSLLQWICSTFLKDTCIGSAMVLYEPCGAFSEKTQEQSTSVTRGFQRVYFERFQAKLDRGKSSNENSTPAASFFPLANSPSSVADRLQLANCAVAVHSVTAEQACVHLLPIPFLSQSLPEMFDEHAALRLYLRSYCLSCIFSNQAPTNKDATKPRILPRLLCPWTTCHARFESRSLQPATNSNDLSISRRIWIAPIRVEDESAAQKVFVKCYEHLFAEYPSVQKMTKTALKKDLVVSKERSNTQSSIPRSTIGRYYQERGGIFLVAISVPCDAAEDDRPLLVGGIGVRKCDAKEKGVRAPSKSRQTFEIHRLFVHPDYRSRGVAQELLNQATRHVLEAHPHNNNDNTLKDTCLVATTLVLLTEAIRFYEKQGFQMLEEEDVANLTLRTYGRVHSEN